MRDNCGASILLRPGWLEVVGRLVTSGGLRFSLFGLQHRLIKSVKVAGS
jgi:hypothetical protein